MAGDPGAGRPYIAKLSPTRARAAGGSPLTIAGTGLGGATEVRFGDSSAQTIMVRSDQQIDVIAPPAYPGTVRLTVTTPAGTSDPQLFTFVSGRGRMAIFFLQMAYLVALLIIGALYFTSLRQTFKNDFGPVPVGVPWFAALGAVIIGLQGVVDHGSDWNEDYNLWHVARPFVGVAFGVVVYLIVLAGIVATGSTQVKTGTATRPTDDIFYYVMAFVVGYRETIFRSLVKRVADVIFTPGA